MLLPALSAQGDQGLIGSWSPGIGDPNVIGWVTTVAYFVTAWCCHWTARRMVAPDVKTPAANRERLLWRVLALALLLLGINKQLDLQTALTEVGRMLAWRQHWFEQRREVQYEFVIVLSVCGVLAALFVLRMAWGGSRPALLASAGTAVLVLFVLLRAASFHHVDMLMESRWMGVTANGVMELAGITTVLGATWLHRVDAKAAPAS